MTDKEKLNAIRAEIHRLVDVRGYDKEMANDLFAFMDSLPNEPVKIDRQVSKMADEFAEREYEINGYERQWLSKGYYHGYIDAGKGKLKEPVSEDLDVIAREYAGIPYDAPKDLTYCVHDKKAKYDAVLFGAQWQREQMMAKAFDFTKEHDTACVLASECLRNHGWFSRERDFNDLWRHLSCVDELFIGKFSGKTKVIVIKED